MKTPGDSNKKNLSHQARETGALKGAGEWNLASVEHTYCSCLSVLSRPSAKWIVPTHTARMSLLNQSTDSHTSSSISSGDPKRNQIET